MCGRFALKALALELVRRFVLDECTDLKPRYNIPPGTEIAAIRHSPRGNVCCTCCAGAWYRTGRRT